MLRTLTIDGFRAFEHFELGGLGRVNLLVGTNNSGKTTVLEAAHALVGCEPAFLWAAQRRRSEHPVDGRANGAVDKVEVDVRHLFHGHDINLRREFTIAGMDEEAESRLAARIWERRAGEDPRQLHLPGADQLVADDDEPPLPGTLRMELAWSGPERQAVARLRLSRRVTWSGSEQHWVGPVRDSQRPVRFVSTVALGPDQVAAFLDAVMLTPEEPILIEALQTIESGIRRIATIGRRPGSPRGGVVVSLDGARQPVPIGSLGDGIWRMLGIALCMVQSEGGYVLIDEIDTGLHYSVMRDMWTMVAKTAERLNVQVFATTHSRDCVEALAAIAHPAQPEAGNVSIQRIDRNRAQAVAYNEREIVMAAKRGIEVR